MLGENWRYNVRTFPLSSYEKHQFLRDAFVSIICASFLDDVERRVRLVAAKHH